MSPKSDGSTDQLDFEVWKRTIDVNVTGVFLCNKHAVKQMLNQSDGGAIVNCGFVHSFVGKAPVGRLGKPEEVERAVLSLASKDASFITGTSLMVDGGYTAV